MTQATRGALSRSKSEARKRSPTYAQINSTSDRNGGCDRPNLPSRVTSIVKDVRSQNSYHAPRFNPLSR
ncbi:MAG: hypothetical protein AB4038_17820 [Prochloraceae cyanobacterium]